MKKAKKLASLLLALIMVLSMSASVFAEGEDPAAPLADETEEKGSITVNGFGGEEYSIYRILDLESYNPVIVEDPTTHVKTDVGDYSYKVNDKWAAFFDTEAATKFFTKDEKGYVTRISKAPAIPANVAAFAESALKWAKEKGITPEDTYDTKAKQPTVETGAACTVEFKDLKLGYYLLDTTLGSLCTLNTTNPNVTINDKNMVPKNTKEVAEGSNWQDHNDAKVGDQVFFRSTLEVKNGVSDLVYHDKMDEALSFSGADKVTVVLDPDTTVVKDKNTPLVQGTDYTVDTATDGCTFHVTFAEAFLKTLETGSHKIVISYQAKLTEKAINVSQSENISKVSYGEKGNETKESKTVTKTWNLPVFKYATGTDGVQKGLSETEFTFASDKAQDNLIPLIMVESGEGKGADGKDIQAVYRVATPEEIEANTNLVKKITTNESGKFVIKGLDSGTYYLKETKAKKGYNAPEDAFTIIITDQGEVKKNNQEAAVVEYGIENSSGSLLPSTGGIGTTIFYVVGSILLVGAAVLLITKKRMSAAE